MKKFLLKFVTVAVAAAVVLGAVSSCELFTVNTDRDMAQVVATVRVSDEVEKENVYKRQLAAGYVNYGYYYVNYNSYTTSQAYKLILDNLVNNAIVTQKSKIETASGAADKVAEGGETLQSVLDEFKGGENSPSYLAVLASAAETEKFGADNPKLKEGGDEYVAKLAEAVYNKYNGKTSVTAKDAEFRFVGSKAVYKALSSAADNVESLVKTFYDDDEEEEKTESRGGAVTYSVRATPTKDADEEEDDVEEYKKNLSDFAEFLKSNKNVAALNKAVKRFIDLGVVNSGISYNAKSVVGVLSIPYFKDTVISSISSEIVSAYEEKLRKDSTGEKIADDYLWSQYVDLYNTQEAQTRGSVSAYEPKLSAVSKDTFMVYDNGIPYGYISHLLIPYSDEQKTEVSDYMSDDAHTAAEKETFLNGYYNKVIAKDLRATWVQSGYGEYDAATGKFKFDDKYIYDTEGELAQYRGTIGYRDYYETEESDGTVSYNFRYYNVSPEEMSADDFIALAYKTLTGETGTIALDVNGAVPASVSLRDAFEKFEDLKFAFSTDTGNFNNYLGYLFSPYTSEKQYVSAFYKACKEIVDAGSAGAFRLFMSKEYGLHIVLLTRITGAGANGLENQYDVETGKAAFIADLENEDSVAYKFKEAKKTLVENNYISKIAQSLIQNYSASAITYYEKTYSDLITE